VTAKKVTTAAEPKSKNSRESSRRLGTGVRSTLGVTKPTRRRKLGVPQVLNPVPEKYRGSSVVRPLTDRQPIVDRDLADWMRGGAS
jgi:hypothetical protein